MACSALLLSGVTRATPLQRKPILGLYVIGQSNAGSRGSDLPLFTRALYPNEVMGANAGFWAHGATLADRSAFTGFVPLRDVATPLPGPLRATTTAFAAEYQLRHSRAPASIYVFTDFDDGMALPAFFDSGGHYNQANVLADVKQAVSVARASGREFQVFGLLWLQGETPSPGYSADLSRLRKDLSAAIMKLTGQGQVPYFLIQQVNQGDGYSGASGVEQEQLDFAHAGKDSGVVMIGPTYQARYLPQDLNHIGSLGRMMLGDIAGLVLSRLIKGEGFVPLWPTEAVLRGKTITLKFAIPGGPLMFDHLSMPPVPDNGFVFSDSQCSAKIKSIRLAAPDTIAIELTAAPTGSNPTISYAINTERNPDGYASGRGILFSEDAASSLYAELGFPVPAKIRHYAVRFRWKLAEQTPQTTRESCFMPTSAHKHPVDSSAGYRGS